MGSKSRAEAFSDGIFAIAATLLVLDLSVPKPEPNLLDGFHHEWPAYAAYATSFLTIGIIYVVEPFTASRSNAKGSTA